MKPPGLKSLSPRSLIGRTVLILLVPILTIQVVVSYVFIQRLYENVTEQMTRSMALSLDVILDRIESAEQPALAERQAGQVARLLDVDVTFAPADAPAADARLFYDLSGRVVMRVLRAEIGGIGYFDLAEPDNRVFFTVGTRHGPVGMEFARNRVSASNPHQLLVLMVFVSIVATLISFLFLKNQIRPIRRLSEAAAAFGKGRVVPYSPSGASEVRLAGRSFLQMRDRIERHREQRTLMLSGVSHDLRTPLTRMKLALSMMPEDPDVAALGRDVADMQRMLDTFLGFARSDATETPETTDPGELAERAVAQARAEGAQVALRLPERRERVALRPVAVERALDNLIRNAMRYGSQLAVSVTIDRDQVRFRVEDDGPGIPESEREEAKKPFARLDPARNLDQGGRVGLGLAIVSDIARQHGGSLVLNESAELGGLQADLFLAR